MLSSTIIINEFEHSILTDSAPVFRQWQSKMKTLQKKGGEKNKTDKSEFTEKLSKIKQEVKK